MKCNKILSAILALLMVAGTFTSLSIMPVFAEDGADAQADTTQTEEPATGEPTTEEDVDYTKIEYSSPEEKLASMKLKVTNEYYELYAHSKTGEIGVKDKRTGQILLSNPYDIASSKGSEDTKEALMSQIIIEFVNNSKTVTYTSYEQAALKDQITLKNIKNGLRVEYSIGRIESRKLVPRWITADDFENYIMKYIRESASTFVQLKFNSYYTLKDASDPSLNDATRNSMFQEFPITKQYAIYVSDANMSDRELNMFENWIKTYCPQMTFELLEEIHSKVGYESQNVSPPLFRMAIEYTLDDTGLIVNLAANAIRFNETAYQLKSVQILPYFGAGNSNSQGFTFIPDGSGTITRFEDVKTQLSLSGKVYGSDYAYHASDPQHRQTMRLPVFGVVENYSHTTFEKVWGTLPENEWYTDSEGNLVTEGFIDQSVTKTENRGYFAILMEGDALAEISTDHGGVLHNYNSVQTKFYPRPTDQYNLSDAISVGSNAVWTVTSDRKYSGNYKIKYIMLTDEAKAQDYVDSLKKENKNDEAENYTYYNANLMGMVNACRDYYEKAGALSRLTNVEENIPLTIETLGTISTTEKILSIPVRVKVPLSTFDDVKMMSETLKASGITNINYKLTGFANGTKWGGLYATVPSNVKWESKAGGADGFKDLMQYAEENGIGIYPEFDFSYVGDTNTFDTFSYKKHAARTMDNRYARKKSYDPAFQVFYSSWYNPISPSVFEYFYNKMSPKLLEYAPTGISVSTLGSDLNSDFDKKDPYNREDSKRFVTELLSQIQKDFSNVMVSGGNAYALPYTNYLVEVPLDSSQYLKSSASVPFMGMVLHGYKNFTGTALNMVGDIDYEVLKIIENGASPYFLLCNQNTDKLKEDSYLQKYYSVDFSIWTSELIEKYNILNEALKDVQDKLIVNYEFLVGYRVLTDEEIKQDEEDQKREEEEQPDTSVNTENPETAPGTQEPITDPVTGEPTTPATSEPDTQEPSTVEPGTEQPSTGADDVENRVNNSKIVRVTYEGGKAFILNYNNYQVRVGDVVIDALSFAVVDAKGE